MQKMIIYQVFPRYFGNTSCKFIPGGSIEDNGCGKFSSFTIERLKKIRETLKVTHIWYTGILDHATRTDFPGKPASSPEIVKGEAGSPYAIRDYYDVAPCLADNPEERMEEFEALVRRTHEAGLKVIIDFVPNHVAREYRSAAGRLNAEKDGKHFSDLGEDDDNTFSFKKENDFFYIPGEYLVLPDEIRLPHNYTEYPAKATGNDCFTSHPSANDWYEAVKLNYTQEHTATWDKMADIVGFWTSKGVDGFRCDMAELVPPEFFRWMTGKIRSEWPDTIFIAEVYNTSRYREYIEYAGFDYLYDKSGLYDTLRAICSGSASARAITGNWQMLGDIQPKMLNFLENHDEQRIASDFFCGKAEKAYAALYVSLLLNNAPFMIYSGQEYGEKGMDTEGFSGRDGRSTIFDYWCVPSVARSITGNLSGQENAIFEKYSSILEEMARSRALSEGVTFDLGYANEGNGHFDMDRHFAFLRYCDGELKLVAANFSDNDSLLRIRIPQHAFDFLGIAPDGKLNPETPVTLEVKAWDGAIITLKH